MSEETVRKYRDADQLPSQLERAERNYRTHPDPLTEFWDEIENASSTRSETQTLCDSCGHVKGSGYLNKKVA